MDYNEYLVKLRGMTNAENPRQAYLNSGFNKTSLYRSLLSEDKLGRAWAYGEKCIYRYLGYAYKAEALKHRVLTTGGSHSSSIAAIRSAGSPDDIRISNKFRSYHRKMTEIAGNFETVLGYSILETIRGIYFE